MKYRKFTQKQFEYLTRNFLMEEKLGFFKDITEEYQQENYTWERIYSISTKNKAVDIMVFSSIDIRSGAVREKDSDAVRLVMRWKTKYGYRYKKLAKHLRVVGLFDNMRLTIRKANDEVFNLDGITFTKDLNGKKQEKTVGIYLIG